MNCNTYFDKKIEIKEAICLMETKINELVEMYNRIDADHAIIAEKVRELEKLIDYLLGAGLAEEVKKKLEEWLADGTLADIIGDTLDKWTARIDDIELRKVEYNKIEKTGPMNRIEIKEPNSNDIQFFYKNIKADDYGILVNNNYETLSGNGLEITNSKIHSKNRDAIEINCPKLPNYKNILISNNTLSTDSEANSDNHLASGFGIGVAGGKNHVIASNIVKYSRKEGLHLEDAIKGMVVSGNGFYDCENIGYKLYADYKETPGQEIPLVSGNVFRGLNKNNYGMYATYNTDGKAEMFAPNNVISNFDIGIYNVGFGVYDNVLIENCNKGLYINGSDIKGSIYLKNTPILLTSPSNAEDNCINKIESLTSLTPINIYKFNECKNTILLNKFSYKLNNDVSIATSGYIETTLLKNIKYFKGIITTKTEYSNTLINISSVYEAEIKDGVLTSHRIDMKRTSSIDNTSLEFSDGILNEKFYSTYTQGRDLNKTVCFDGTIIITP